MDGRAASDLASEELRARTYIAAVTLLLIAHALLLAFGAWRHAPTVDEIAYLGAGLSHWDRGRFELARVSPPLVRLVAALPVLAADPKLDWHSYTSTPGRRDEHAVGYDFLMANGERSFWLFTIARWACIPFSVIGGWFCWRWASRLYGNSAGVFALALWCFDPNVIAHGQLITPDMGVTAFCLAASYCFWRWLESPTWGRAIAAGLALALAQAAKTTVIIFFGLWPVMWLLWALCSARDKPEAPARNDGVTDPRLRFGLVSRRIFGRELLQLGAMLVIAVYGLNMVYGFQGSARRLGDFEFVSASLAGRMLAHGETGNRFRESWLGQLPVPLPADYVLGIDAQKRDFEDPERRFRAYLGGEWGETGWWYYYLYAMAIKLPIGAWLLIAAAVLSWFADRSQTKRELILLAPAIVLFVFVSAQTGINQHFRYVLPALPFAFIFASNAARGLNRRTALSAFAVVALVAHVSSSLWAYPHSLSYFNEIVGGPRHGSEHLLQSNLDWGQDLLYLREWSRAHPEAQPLRLAYHGSVRPSLAGLSEEPPPGESEHRPQPGWYAVSVVFPRGETWPRDYGIEYFRKFEPVDRVGYTINVYHLTPESIEAAEADLHRATP